MSSENIQHHLNSIRQLNEEGRGILVHLFPKSIETLNIALNSKDPAPLALMLATNKDNVFATIRACVQHCFGLVAVHQVEEMIKQSETETEPVL